MRKAVAAGTAALMLSFVLVSAAVGVEPKKPVSLRWAFVALTEKNGAEVLTPIVRDTVLNTGERFKIFMAPEEGTFTYLIYQSSQNALHLLYPDRPAAYDTASAGDAAVLPPGEQWFQLDEHPGEEIFFLIAADRRMRSLENLLHRHQAATTPSEQAAAAERVLAEIRRLRWENREFKSTAERPTAVMGQLRGVKKPPKTDGRTVDISDHAIRIEADGFYSRTFTIDHRR